MSTRGWENVKESEIAAKVSRGSVRATRIDSQPSKYRNVKTVVDGIRFDSKRESEHWLVLRELERGGAITELERQVRFPLYAPEMDEDGIVVKSPLKLVQIAEYVADFTYRQDGKRIVVDSKARRISPYPLKAKWLALQQGIHIVEV